MEIALSLEGLHVPFRGHRLRRKEMYIMAEHIGIVIQGEGKDLVRVTADRKGACGGCDLRGGGCKSCLAGADKMETRAVNSAGARPGDLVKLKLPASSLFTGAALLYLLPVAGLLVGALTGNRAFGPPENVSAVGAIAGAFLGLAVGYAVLIAVDRAEGLRSRWMPIVTQVIQSNVGAPAGLASTGKKASCCG